MPAGFLTIWWFFLLGSEPAPLMVRFFTMKIFFGFGNPQNYDESQELPGIIRFSQERLVFRKRFIFLFGFIKIYL